MSRQFFLLFKVVLFFIYLPLAGQNKPVANVNDITQLNPIIVDTVVKPRSTWEIMNLLKNYNGNVSIGGGRFSMGGQVASENTMHLDMRQFDSILFFSPEEKIITVQTGITWRKIQNFIDTYNLSVKIMQTYANFTVGGSLSVNVHGRYIGLGPLVLSVREIKMVLANGKLIVASPNQNAEIFYGAIGGYGGLGVITEATLELIDNCHVRRTDERMPIEEYASFFKNTIRSDTNVVFHNADIYPGKYKTIRAVSYNKTQKEVTVNARLKPTKTKYRFNRAVINMISGAPGGKWIRQHVVDPIIYAGNPIEWRNYEASYNVYELEPRSRKRHTFVLQEYFVPVNEFANFYPKMREVLRKHHVNVLNISIRHAKSDPGTVLAWAPEEVFAFVIYYRQGTSENDKKKVMIWTRELIDSALTCRGRYYLPYQLHATQQQFEQAYPGFRNYIELKKQLDPDNKFRNKFLDKYFIKN